jgi:hypothetical protein
MFRKRRQEPAAFPEIPLFVAPVTDAAKQIIGFQHKESLGNRHKLGGDPDWVQPPEHPHCSCGESMKFYGQLDSVGDRMKLGDCGMVYVFVCIECGEHKSVLQSY